MNAIAALLISKLTRTARLAIEHNLISGHDFVCQVSRSSIFDQLPGFKRPKPTRYAKNLDYPVSARNKLSENALYVLAFMQIIPAISNPKIFKWPRVEANPDYLVYLNITWPIEQFMAKILTRTCNLKSLSWMWIYRDSMNEDPETTVLNFGRIKKSVSPVIRGILEALKFRNSLSFNQIMEFRELTQGDCLGISQWLP